MTEQELFAKQAANGYTVCYVEAGWNEEIHFDGYVEDYEW